LFSFCLMGIQCACGAVQERQSRGSMLLRSGSIAPSARFKGLRPFNAAEPRAWPLCGV
jgi:hypothetical protein